MLFGSPPKVHSVELQVMDLSESPCIVQLSVRSLSTVSEMETDDIGNTGQDEAGLDEEIQEMLITEVKKRRILYDCSTNSNRNKLLRENAWADIAKAIGKTDIWCKTEWGKLRAAYNRKKKSLKGKTGQARKKIESWCHFFPLQFLDDFDVVAPTSGNMSSQDELNSPVSTSSHSGRLDSLSNSPCADSDLDGRNINQTGTEDLEKNNTQIEKPVKKDFTYSSNRNKRSADKIDEEIVNFLKRPKQELDEHHHFGMSTAEQLRKMSPEMASVAKIKIQQILHDCRFPVIIPLTIQTEEN